MVARGKLQRTTGEIKLCRMRWHVMPSSSLTSAGRLRTVAFAHSAHAPYPRSWDVTIWFVARLPMAATYSLDADAASNGQMLGHTLPVLSGASCHRRVRHKYACGGETLSTPLWTAHCVAAQGYSDLAFGASIARHSMYAVSVSNT